MARKALMWVKNITDFGRFCYLNTSLAQNKYYFNLYEFLKQRIHAFVGKLKNRCFCWFPTAIFMPLKGTQPRHLHTKPVINLGKTFFRISRIWSIAQTWFLGKLSRIFIFFHVPDSRLSVKVSIFSFDGVKVKTPNSLLHCIAFNNC